MFVTEAAFLTSKSKNKNVKIRKGSKYFYFDQDSKKCQNEFIYNKPFVIVIYLKLFSCADKKNKIGHK